MTTKGKIFKAYVEFIIYYFGMFSKKMVKLSPDTLLKMNDDHLWALRQELIDEGWLYEHRTTRTTTHGWVSHRGSYGVMWTGVTEKGWSVAHKYIGIITKEEAQAEFKNAYALDHAGTDMLTSMDDYKREYINKMRPGWYFL